MKMEFYENLSCGHLALICAVFAIFVLINFSCKAVKNTARPEITKDEQENFHITQDGVKLFVYEYIPTFDHKCTVFIISGITGINHNREKDIIEQLSNNENRIVAIHPRGTGYSEGKRGDISDFSIFINDHTEIIKNDKDFNSGRHKIILYGHSMSSAIALAVADNLENIGGVILVNPPYILKKAKGMSPGLQQYFKYACYMIFAKHKPVVNMAGEPSLIENEEDRKESEQRIYDPLLVKYFSMYMMIESKKIMNSMPEYSKKAIYPLLLIYGDKDNIVDKRSCDIIFDAWKFEKKKYMIIENGTHGKTTVKLAENIINEWIADIKKE